MPLSPHLAGRLQAFFCSPNAEWVLLPCVNKLNKQPCAKSAGNPAQLSSRWCFHCLCDEITKAIRRMFVYLNWVSYSVKKNYIVTCTLYCWIRKLWQLLDTVPTTVCAAAALPRGNSGQVDVFLEQRHQQQQQEQTVVDWETPRCPRLLFTV